MSLDELGVGKYRFMENKQNYLLESDENLLLLFSNSKDKVALEVLFNRHMTSAYYLALKYMRNQADAEDVVQKAFINIMRFASHQNQQGKVRAWIMKTVINTSKNEIQTLVIHRKHIQKKSTQQSVVCEDQHPDSDELRKTLVAAIENLPEHFRLPIWLTHYEDMSIKEVADCLGKPEKTIRTQIARGLEKLEQALKGQLSNINAMGIIAILADCKLNDKPPLTLAYKINSISSMKISARMMPQALRQKYFLSTYLLPSFCILLLSVIGYYWWQNHLGLSRKTANILAKTSSINEVNNLPNNEKLDLFTDFNSGVLPEWCNFEKGEFNLSDKKNGYGYFLKSDISNFFVLHLKISPQTKPFVASYDIMPSLGKETFPRFYSLSGGDKKNMITFCYDIPLNLNQWNHVEIIAQDNVESMWFNGLLKMVVVSDKAYEYPYQIACADFVAKIDNLKVISLETNKVPEFSKFINIANQMKNSTPPFSTQIPSPIKHQFSTVKVYSGRSESNAP